MKVQFNKLSNKAKAGFSLVELLVVIAVIGIMAAIAIPMISNINANATTAKNKRNAQNIASVYGAAAAAGAALSTSALATAINSLQAGIPGSGQFATTTFRVQISDTEEASAIAATSMTLADGVISFVP